jgi:hypothetical protein
MVTQTNKQLTSTIDFSEKITKLMNILEDYKKESAIDVKIDNGKFENNFNRNDLILKWLDRSMNWKMTLDASKDILAKVISNLNDKYLSESLYNITDKNLKTKVESDSEYQTYKKHTLYVELVHDYCVKMMDILKSQTFEIRNKLEYLKFINGLDK